MTLLRRILLLLLLLVLLAPPGALFWLTSDSGTRWLAQQLPGWLQPLGVTLELGAVDGSLRHRIGLDGLRIELDGASFAAERLELIWRPRALLVQRIEVVSLIGHGMRVSLPAADPAPSAPQAINLPDMALPLVARLEHLALSGIEVVSADQTQVVERLAGKLLLDRHGLHLSDFRLQLPALSATGFASIDGVAPHAVIGSIAVDVDQALTGPDVGALSAQLLVSGPALRPSIEAGLVTPAAVRLHGDVDISDGEPRFALQGRAATLSWPLQGQARFTATDTWLQATGKTDDYRVSSRTLLSGDGLPSAQIDLQLDGDAAGATVERLRIDALRGSIDVDGRVSWQPGVSWDVRINALGLDPASLDADWPGRLNAGLRASGELKGDEDSVLHVQVTIDTLNGQLRGYPVAASGGVTLVDDVVTLQGIELLSERNRILAEGIIGERMDARLVLDAPALGALIPDAGGALGGQVSVTGSRQAPQLVAELAGSAVAIAGFSVDKLDIDASWAPDRVDADVSLVGLDTGSYVLDRVEAKAAGMIARHQITLDADGPELALSLAAEGGVDGKAWRGQLERLLLKGSMLGDWGLERAVDVVVSGRQAQLGQACLSQADESVCVEGGWQAPNLVSAAGRATALRLERLAPLLPGEGSIEGLLDAEFELGGTTLAPVARATLRPRDGVIRAETDTEPVEVSYRDARVDFDYERDRGSLSINLLLDDDGVTRGRIDIGPDRPQGRELSGAVQAKFPDLSLVAGFVPVLTDVRGGFRLDVGLAGTTTMPRVSGRMSIDDARAAVVPAGIALDEIDLVIAGDGVAPLSVDGRLRSGGGILLLSGRVGPWADGNLAMELGIKGDRFQAVRLPEVSAWISPDIQLRGDAEFRVTGVLGIPRAVVEIDSLPEGAVSVSSDEIIVGDTAPVGRNMSSRVSGDVRVELGDDVTFDGFGLSTGLVGAIQARFDQRGNQVDGRIEMRDGAYRAYGQDLEIEQGRILFAGPPENPEVDLRAVRVSRDGEVRAYLAMSGPLREPRPRIYSEPSLAESEALAYLLTGRGLNQAGSGERFDIASAAFALGVAQGDPLLQNISEQLGLDDLRVEAGEDGIESSTLLLGRYLNPDLYVGYTQELFNPEGAVLVRMRLNRHFEVETRSGRTQSVDLFFRHERD